MDFISNGCRKYGIVAHGVFSLRLKTAYRFSHLRGYATSFSQTNPQLSVISRAPPWSNTIELGTVNERTIWHESAHRLDFEKHRQLSTEYNRLAGVSLGLFCDMETPDGLYYRDYAWNPEVVKSRLYEVTYGRMEPFADAFAAWVFYTTKGYFPNGTVNSDWRTGRAGANDPNHPEWLPQWDAIITYAVLSLSTEYGYGR